MRGGRLHPEQPAALPTPGKAPEGASVGLGGVSASPTQGVRPFIRAPRGSCAGPSSTKTDLHQLPFDLSWEELIFSHRNVLGFSNRKAAKNLIEL